MIFGVTRLILQTEWKSSGAPGMINISATTYEILKDHEEYEFESRGKIEAKGKGLMEMYFVYKK